MVNFFQKRARYPRFKRRKDTRHSFRIPQRVKIADGRVYLPKIGWIKIRQSQPVDCPTKSATFKRAAMMTGTLACMNIPVRIRQSKRKAGSCG
jgi:putative transposase